VGFPLARFLSAAGFLFFVGALSFPRMEAAGARFGFGSFTTAGTFFGFLDVFFLRPFRDLAKDVCADGPCPFCDSNVSVAIMEVVYS